MDGTLLRSSRLTRDVFDVAVEHVLGRHPGDHGVRMSGKTDPLIALEILAAVGLAEDDARSRLSGVMERLEAELAAAAEELRDNGRVLPGVADILPRMQAEPGVVQSVLTGNTAANAAVKVRAFSLERWLDLDVGAFGSDHHDRGRLVPVALERARRRHGRRFAPGEVWVVGDTPGDLACARAGGARCLLVATGAATVEQLGELGADRVVADLSAVDEVCDLLLS